MDLKARLEQLQQQSVEAQMNWHALQGAIAQIKWIMEQQEKENAAGEEQKPESI